MCVCLDNQSCDDAPLKSRMKNKELKMFKMGPLTPLHWCSSHLLQASTRLLVFLCQLILGHSYHLLFLLKGRVTSDPDRVKTTQMGAYQSGSARIPTRNLCNPAAWQRKDTSSVDLSCPRVCVCFPPYAVIFTP